MMNNRILLIGAVVVIVVAGVAYALGHRNALNYNNGQPQGVLGNVMAGLSDSINQAGNQAKANADRESARQHFDAAKSALGIHPDNGSGSD
jgi:hypothetical protein